MIKFNNKIGMRDDLFNAYVKSIKADVMSYEDEYKCFEAYHNGDEKERETAKNQIVLANQGIVIKIARSYGTADNVMDLISVGNVALINAIESYDYEKRTDGGKPIKFISYAIWLIRRDVLTYLLNENQSVQKSNISKTYSKLAGIKERFFQQNMRYPTIDEIKDILKKEYNIVIKDDVDLYDLTYNSINSSYDGEEDENMTFENAAVFTSRTASENDYVKKEDEDYNHALIDRLLSICNDREQTIIRMLYGIGYDKEYTIEETSKIFGLSGERIRQLKKSIEKKMARYASSVLTHVG